MKNEPPIVKLAAGSFEPLRQILDLEMEMNIVDRGLIHKVAGAGFHVRGDITSMTYAGRAMTERIRGGAEMVLLSLASSTEALVELVFDPPWPPGMIADPVTPYLA